MNFSGQGDSPKPPEPPTPPSNPSPTPGSQGQTVSQDTTKEATAPVGILAPGQLLGSRYRVNRLLGRGGMGEVWHAYDLKLQVDVALKSILSERFPGERGLALLRGEVRAAREVISPNVCRIFDLVEEGGREFVSMEYIDGTTLLEVLRERGPLDLREAMRLASQFLAGLEAIHQAGLVHRDVKPENVMITRTGRVVLMDFGLAKGISDDQQRTVAGTPAYMAPEQMWGVGPDPRADVFSAGVVLAEMIAPEGIAERKSREAIWQGVRQSPVKLGESPWRGVLERAVAVEPSRRYGTVRELARALEEVTLRVEGVEDRRPYPGLSSFTVADAEYFFGREEEVEAVWKKVQRASLLGIIGPSGAGKTSFLQAGLLPAAPSEWRYVMVRPGSSPFVALAQALVPELSGDPEAMHELVEMERPERALAAVGRWRARHAQVLLVVDQFEELFTLCRPEAQAGFADLLGHLAQEADVHVLLAMRDDFLFRCHEHPRLAPLAADLTMLGPPAGSALRRALIQPALLCGYRFEDESLADEMLEAIEGERGALPMLAFTAARLWEQRDRERGVLTRATYERIGGVSGALAQHAEATLERIGSERLPMVREIFRNLVTAQGTRAVVEVGELLSVFEDREAAEEVLRALVDARLLTSFEADSGREGFHEHRVEIVHESLLTGWPRLVRWHAQDAEGALLRDQLRLQARLWEERGRPDDLLWAGSSYREFTVWRERYPGGLTAAEEAFAKTMVARAERQRRRRRLAAGATIALLSLIIVVIGLFARREQVARRKAEASTLLTLGRSELENDPSSALAYAIASLELTDNPITRQFAIEALARGPAAAVIPVGGSYLPNFLDFSPDGKWLAVGGVGGVRLYSRSGSPPIVLCGPLSSGNANASLLQRPQFAPDGDRVVFTPNEDPRTILVWSVSRRHEVSRFHVEGPTLLMVRGERLYLFIDTGDSVRTLVRSWNFKDAAPKTVGWWSQGKAYNFDVDNRGRWLAYYRGRCVYVRPLEGFSSSRERLVGEHAGDVGRVRFDPAGERLASEEDATGEIRIWSLNGESTAAPRVIQGKGQLRALTFNPSGGVLAAAAFGDPDRDVRLWNLEGPQDADPVVLHRPSYSMAPVVAFDPRGQWIAATYHTEIAFWPLTCLRSFVLHGTGRYGAGGLVFTGDGRSLVGGLANGGVRIWSLMGGPTRDLPSWHAGWPASVAADPLGRFLVAGTGSGAFLVSLADGQARRLPDVPPGTNVDNVTVSWDGRLVAANVGFAYAIWIWDLDAGTSRVLANSEDYFRPFFTEDGRVLAVSWSNGDIRRWNLADGSSVVLVRGRPGLSLGTATRDGRVVFVRHSADTTAWNAGASDFTRFDLVHHNSQPITDHGNQVVLSALDSAGAHVATLDATGVTRVGPISGDDPHLLLAAAKVAPRWLDISPDGHWIATSNQTNPTVYLWRRPEGRPLQSLPHGDFLERLRALTHYRAVPDRNSPTGYRLDQAPYHGWEKVPTW